jgi:hypothetical protein
LKRTQKLGTIDLDLCLLGCTKEGFHGMISRVAMSSTDWQITRALLDWCPLSTSQLYPLEG